MAKRETTAARLLADKEKLIEVLQKASDLTVAVVTVSYVDAALENLIRSRLQDETAANELLDVDRPLGSYGARCRIARAMGLLPDAAYDDLKKIGRIRNLFAHHH